MRENYPVKEPTISEDSVANSSGGMDASPPRRHPFQFSLGFLILLTLVMAIMGSGLMYASLVPAVQEELSLLTGEAAPDIAVQDGRSAHIAFIMFTFTSPLILAGALSTALAVFQWLIRSGRIRPTVIRQATEPAIEE